MATYVTSGQVGIDLTANDATAQFTPGLTVKTSDGGEAVYVQATSTIAQYDACIIINTSSASSPSIGCVPVTTTNALTSQRLAFAQTAITSSYYGWVQTSGNNIRVKALVACQPAVPLFTTSTAGSLDDTVVTAGYCLGVVLMSSATSASAPLAVAGNTVIRTWSGG